MRYEEVLKSFSWDDVKKYFGQDFRDKLIREGGEVGVLRVDDKWNKQSLSYSQLKDKAQKLSSFLRNEFKVSKGDVMACLAE
ncbi:AMP-dependent synthetase, partial [Sulfolobus sp. B5]